MIFLRQLSLVGVLSFGQLLELANWLEPIYLLAVLTQSLNKS